MILIRFFHIDGGRIGHFAGNPEVYLCEIDEGINRPAQWYVDLFYLIDKKNSNKQLLKMWQRVLHIWPKWILFPIQIINSKIPGGKLHVIGYNSNHDRDIQNLFDKHPKHIFFNETEKKRGMTYLKKMGLKKSDKIVCLQVRDSAFLSSKYPEKDWKYHNFRDSNIDDYILAAEELVKKGYIVIRMGAKVNKSISTNNPKIIDYATNGMRSDFMDVYLAWACEFILTTGSGWDSISMNNFRKPIVMTNFAPLGVLGTYHNNMICVLKKYYSLLEKRILNHSEIYENDIFFSLRQRNFDDKNISVINNTSKEIKDACNEMVERLNNSWSFLEDDEKLQNQFWYLYQSKKKLNGWTFHGKIKARIGTLFLRDNPEFLN